LVGCGSHDLGPAERDDKEHAELAKALKGVKVSLEKGLSASESQGNPISRKFEVEDGKLQLSVYTIKGDKFPEVIIDHKTGKTAKIEAITGGDDLAAAKAQSSAMPSMKDGHPVAEITLLKGEMFKTVSEKLD